MVTKNSTYILITRPKKQARILSSKLKNLGHKILIMPLLKIIINDQITPSLINQKKLQAVLITSSNAIQALSKLNLPKDIKLL